MPFTVTEETFASLAAQSNHLQSLRWNSVFVLPTWLEVWWRAFGAGARPCLLSLKQGEQSIGVAPMMLKDGKASFMGSANVCDYLDFVIAPEQENAFFNVLLDDLKRRGITQLDLGAVRPDSAVFRHLIALAGQRGCGIQRQQEDVSVEMDLPPTWDEYLERLEAKQRHELKRKMRRLTAEGNLDYHSVSDPALLSQTLDAFFRMFTESRRDKANFLTAGMEAFFRSLVSAMGQIGLVRFGVLELDGMPTAMILYFDYNNGVWLYNSGYEPRYDALSVGLVCKALSIKDSIEAGKKKYDFLKGNEPYKYYLGGKEVPLYRFQITLQ